MLSIRAKELFDDTVALADVIKTNIFPKVIIIKILNGKYGMGFFAHPTWLVSNAHVISSIDDINTGIRLKMYTNNYNNNNDNNNNYNNNSNNDNYNYKVDDNYNNNTKKNDDNNNNDNKSDNSELIDIYEKGYFRPLKHNTPDLVTIKIRSSNAMNIQKGLLKVPTHDQLYSEKLYFYVDSEFIIHFLSLISDSLQMPLKFKSEIPPQLGCSGSPIFMAQVILGKQPQWKFTVVAAIFAKDRSDVLYGISVMEEFEQIRMILIDTDQAQHNRSSRLIAVT